MRARPDAFPTWPMPSLTDESINSFRKKKSKHHNNVDFKSETERAASTMSSENTTTKKKLAEAAAALVQAVNSETSPLDISREVAEAVLELAQGQKDHTQPTLEAIRVGIDALNANLVQLHQTLNESIQKQEKLHRIEFAIEQCQFGSFNYTPYGTKGNNCPGADLMKAILFSFRRGKGYQIPLDFEFSYGHNEHPRSNEKKMASNQQLREYLTNQLFTLLDGVMPVWDEPEMDGRRTIRYP
jgi:hypothetical protein